MPPPPSTVTAHDIGDGPIEVIGTGVAYKNLRRPIHCDKKSLSAKYVPQRRARLRVDLKAEEKGKTMRTHSMAVIGLL